MTKIKQMTIGGFRGILAPFTLKFLDGGSIRSMAIYGRNGTGKSSITDAWEWFHTEKIMHLAREGAGPSAYPHLDSHAGDTYIEVELSDLTLGKVRLDYDHSRITKPVATGNIEEFRAIAPHPCHIRFEDLTRFVYLTKSEKFDALSQLMGFTPQVDLQKSLRRVLRKLFEELDKRNQNKKRIKSELITVLGSIELNESVVIKSINKIASVYQIPKIEASKSIAEVLDKLTRQVENDPRAKELSSLRYLHKLASDLKAPDDLIKRLGDYLESAQEFKVEEKEIISLLLLELYEQGDNVLTRLEEKGEKIKVCPLCGEPYKGDLHAHISEKLASLKSLKESRDTLDVKRKESQEKIPPEGKYSKFFPDDSKEIRYLTKIYPIDVLQKQLHAIENTLISLRKLLAIKPEGLNREIINSIRSKIREIMDASSELCKNNNGLLVDLTNRIEALESDNSRKQLVADHSRLGSIQRLWSDLRDAQSSYKALLNTSNRFNEIVNNYVESSNANVSHRFELISADVQTCFEILEADTEGLCNPKLRLLTDEDRAVELQVEFRGEPVCPAYRYLSESQLNSFGLSIFLASARYFNKDFKFLILDDVINSFDGYKRPKVIEILKNQFPEHQILLLTHDNVWSERLFEVCPSWIKRHFSRYEPHIGPFDSEGFAPLEIIIKSIDDDEPVQAGQYLGPFLERQVQELCECFEALVKYNQRNEYSLDPILDRFRIRVKDKLKETHPLYIAVKGLQNELGFRNLCAHWKNPSIQITREEMNMVVNKWIAIEALIRCKESNCNSFVRYDNKSAFVCPCGKTRLECK